MFFVRDVGRGRTGLLVAIGVAGLCACGGEDGDGAGPAGLPGPPPGNRTPTARLEVSPTSGTAPLEVRIQVDGDDPDGSVILFVADLNGDGDQDDPEESQSRPIDVTRTFDESVTIRARVQDDDGAFSPEQLQIVTVQRQSASMAAGGVGEASRGP